MIPVRLLAESDVSLYGTWTEEGVIDGIRTHLTTARAVRTLLPLIRERNTCFPTHAFEILLEAALNEGVRSAARDDCIATFQRDQVKKMTHLLMEAHNMLGREAELDPFARLACGLIRESVTDGE